MKKEILSAMLGVLSISLAWTAACGSDGFVTAEDTVLTVVKHPAFKDFGRFILPMDSGMRGAGLKLRDIASLLPYHSGVRTDTTLSVINRMIGEAGRGERIFYDYYTEEQKRENVLKRSTGLFFFRGKPGAPFAIICPGGGFSYVGSIHEGFPHALELSEKGYNAFVIQYRTGGERLACEDLAAAIAFIFENAGKLQVRTKDYSLWGSSAGARMAARLASYGTAAYGAKDLPGPGAVIMAYTGHTDYTPKDPPTFIAAGSMDGIASPLVMERRASAMKAAGIDAEFHKYPNVAHGFGLGLGTSAEGWVGEAAAFWEKYISN